MDRATRSTWRRQPPWAGHRGAGVHNLLEVVLPEGSYRDDVKLATAAKNALAQNVTVADNVEATAEDGNITLTGRCPAAPSAPPTQSTSTCTYGRPWTALR